MSPDVAEALDILGAAYAQSVIEAARSAERVMNLADASDAGTFTEFAHELTQADPTKVDDRQLAAAWLIQRLDTRSARVVHLPAGWPLGWSWEAEANMLRAVITEAHDAFRTDLGLAQARLAAIVHGDPS